MRVLIIGHSYLAEENRKQLDIIGLNVELEVASPGKFKGMIFSYDQRNDFIEGKAWKLHFYDKWEPPKFPEAAYLLKSIDLGMRRFKPDIIHIEGDPFTPFFIQAFLTGCIVAPKAKIVCTVKQNTYTSRSPLIDMIKDGIARIFVPFVNRFITVNSGVASIYKDRFKADESKMTYCTQLGVDTDLFAPPTDAEKERCLTRFFLKRGEFLLGYCGRFVEYKGITDLIEAVILLRQESGENICLALLGDGPLKEQLNILADENPWIQILKPVPHSKVADFLKAIDLFVMPSRILPWHVEHDAHALLEAMATGVPSIGTRCGAINDVVPCEDMLVDPEDPKSLKAKINQFFTDSLSSKVLGERSRRHVLDNYSLNAVSRKYIEVYNDVLNR